MRSVESGSECSWRRSWCFDRYCIWTIELATVLSVEIAVLHNFVWHENVTWADRKGLGSSTG